MRMVLTKGRGKYLYLDISKTHDEKELVFKDEQTDEELFRLKTSLQDSPSIHPNSSVIKIAMEKLGGELTLVEPSKYVALQESGGDILAPYRTWRIIEGSPGVPAFLEVWLPETKRAVRLPIEPHSGTHTPDQEVPEIAGQPEMLFTVALGLKTGMHMLLQGPTGIGKTTIFRWFAQMLNWNFVHQPITRGTESYHMIGEHLPAGQALFEWTDGPITTAVRMSSGPQACGCSDGHPTIGLLDEMNRIGNIAEYSRLYPVLDDTRTMELKERRSELGAPEVLKAGKVVFGGTTNPSDDMHADYIGVQDLDPALLRRFALQPELAYPPVEVEAHALLTRVPGLSGRDAQKMAEAAKAVREAADVRFPMSFSELLAWGAMIPYWGYASAAEVAVIQKASPAFRESIRDLLQLQGDETPDDAVEDEDVWGTP